jgi:hypothetical protein
MQADARPFRPAPSAYEARLALDDGGVAHLALRDAPALAADEEVGATFAVHDAYGTGAAIHRRMERSGERIGEQSPARRLVT